ncbi:MAG TPA: hypothetical protein VEB42_13810 [Chitinophagaceae bacterium]|nr:hypothetical protein [Chitinophagaceae bacterium]
MPEKNKDLPARSDVTPKQDDNRYKQQDEYATPNSTDAKNTRETEKMRDSLENDQKLE